MITSARDLWKSARKDLVHARSECTGCIIYTRFTNCDPFQIGAEAHPLRARARITSHFGVLRHPFGKARGLRILLICKGRATPPDGIDRRPKMGSYSCASPNIEGSFTFGLLSNSCSSSHCFTIIFQGAPPQDRGTLGKECSAHSTMPAAH